MLEHRNAIGIEGRLVGEDVSKVEQYPNLCGNRNKERTRYFSKDIRESMAVLPRFLQPLLTSITGKPLPSQSPSVAHNPALDFTLSILAFMLIVGGNLYALSLSIWIGCALLPICWTLTTGLLRKFQVVFGHHAAHRLFFRKNARANQFMLDVLTTLPLAQNGAEYRHDHFSHHNRSVFTTYNDPDANFLYKFGFQPGKSVSNLRRTLWATLLSPRFHCTFLAARIHSNFVTRPLAWRMVSVAWTLFLTIGISQFLPWWHVALVVWIPYCLLYNCSALLQFLTEHPWLVSVQAPMELAFYADRCWGRFLGTRCPLPTDNRLAHARSWAKWWLEMVFVHVPIRLGVLVGDLPAHDWHHLCGFLGQEPGSWPIATFSRQYAIDSGRSMGMEDRELWGLSNMLNQIFSALAGANTYSPHMENPRSAPWRTSTTTENSSQ